MPSDKTIDDLPAYLSGALKGMTPTEDSWNAVARMIDKYGDEQWHDGHSEGFSAGQHDILDEFENKVNLIKERLG